MGSKASKATRVASARPRKYPSRLPETHSSPTIVSTGQSSISAGVHPRMQISWEKDEAIMRDMQDPDFQSMLRAVGAVQPRQIPDPAQKVPLNSQSSNSLHTLSRRQILDDQQSNESSALGTNNNRTWADASTILRIVSLRDEKGIGVEQIERDFRLAPGFLKRLGTKISKP